MYSIALSRVKVEIELESSKKQIAYLEDLPLSAQEKIANYDIQIRYEVDKTKWWKSLLTLNRSNMAKFHEKLTSKELEIMEMANEMDGDWSLTSVMDGGEFKNDNGYLELCREYKRYYEQRKEILEAEEIIFKDDEFKVVVEVDEAQNQAPDFNGTALRQALRADNLPRGLYRGGINFITGTGTKPREYKPRR